MRPTATENALERTTSRSLRKAVGFQGIKSRSVPQECSPAFTGSDAIKCVRAARVRRTRDARRSPLERSKALRLSYKMCTAGWRAELSRSGKEAADAKSRIPRPRPHPQEGKRAFRATLRPPWGLKWPAGKPGGRRRSWDQQGTTGRPGPFRRPSDHRARHQSAAPLRPQGLL